MNRRFRYGFPAVLALAAVSLPTMAAGPKPGGSASRIAYTTWAAGGGMTQVFLINPDGSGRVQLTKETWKQHRNSAWSPDGTRLAVSVDIANVYPDTGTYIKVIDVASGSYVQFPAPVSSVSWSGRRDAGTGKFLSAGQQMLVYSGSGANGYSSNLFVCVPDGSGTPLPLTANAAGTYADAPTWLPGAPGSATTQLSYTLRVYTANPDGASTLTTQEVRLMTLDASAWPAVTVISDQPMPAVSPLPAGVNPPSNLALDRQAKQVVWGQSGGPGFWLAPVAYDASGNLLGLDLARTAPLAKTGTAGSPWTASFSPDGSQVAFLDNPAGTGNRSLYRINSNNTGRTLVYRGQYDITSQCWSP